MHTTSPLVSALALASPQGPTAISPVGTVPSPAAGSFRVPRLAAGSLAAPQGWDGRYGVWFTQPDSNASSDVSTSRASTTASDGDYWKERGDRCEECGRPWNWAVWCRLCQACRDSEVHLRRVQGQLRIRPPCVINKAESLSARPGFSIEWYSITPCRQALPVASKATSPQPACGCDPAGERAF